MSRDVKKRIVVAEDDAAILELVTIRLELAGYHAIPARDGFQALDRVRAMQPDAMILDIGLPGLDGFGVLGQLGKRLESLPVCMLTARHTSNDVQRAILMGARGYLTKPFDDQVLLDRVARLFKKAPNASNVWAI